MRRFFIIVFIVSVAATAAAFYWRTYQPEEAIVAAAPESADKRSFSRRSISPEASPTVIREPSDRQDLAMMISLVSSVISAIAAIFQTWLTARSIRNRA